MDRRTWIAFAWISLMVLPGCRKDCCDYREAWAGEYIGDYRVQVQHFFPPWISDTTYEDVHVVVSLVEGSEDRVSMHFDGGFIDQFGVDADGSLHHFGLAYGAFTTTGAGCALEYEYNPPMGGNQTMLIAFAGSRDTSSVH